MKASVNPYVYAPHPRISPQGQEALSHLPQAYEWLRAQRQISAAMLMSRFCLLTARFPIVSQSMV